MQNNRISQKLEDQEFIFGAAVQMNAPWVVEMCAYAGFDYVLLDAEHGAAGHGMPELITAAQASGITPIARIPDHNRSFILPYLEAGVSGIWAPMVNTAEQARQLVEQVKYEPLGRRGFSLATRAAQYGRLSREEHLKRSNREIMLIVTIETVEAISHAAEIASVPGIDMIFIGRDDLCESLGAADRNDPVVQQAVRTVIMAVDKKVPLGTTAFSAQDVSLWSDLGIQLFLTGTTRTIQQALGEALQELVSSLH